MTIGCGILPGVLVSWDHFQRQAEIEPHLANVIEANRRRLLLQLIGIDIEYRHRFGTPLTAEEYVVRFPELPLASVATLFENTADLPNAVPKTVVPKTDRPSDTGAFANREPKGNAVPKTIHYFGDYELMEMVARGGMDP